MRRVITIGAALCITAQATALSNAEMKERELAELTVRIFEAKKRVKKAWSFRLGDLLQLLPTVTVGKRAPYETFTDADTSVSLSISSGQLWDVSDRYGRRDAIKTKALRGIQTNGFIIRKYIERKYLLMERLWKFTQIRRSIDNPVDIAALDEKMDEIRVKIQEIEIGIEKAFAEIEYLVVDAGG
jgi:hypothetical protein